MVTLTARNGAGNLCISRQCRFEHCYRSTPPEDDLTYYDKTQKDK